MTVLPAMTWLHTHHRWATIELTPWRFVALFLAVDFCYYCFHRASHRIRWFWCAHVVHHGSKHMNLTTAMRQSWLYSFAGNWLFYLPAAIGMLLFGLVALRRLLRALKGVPVAGSPKAVTEGAAS